jgi:hypothetical protein
MAETKTPPAGDKKAAAAAAAAAEQKPSKDQHDVSLEGDDLFEEFASHGG